MKTITYTSQNVIITVTAINCCFQEAKDCISLINFMGQWYLQIYCLEGNEIEK